MDTVHWESRAWRKNLDETATDAEHPQAFPAQRPTDLMGRIRVRLCAEDGGLVAYGFGGQRIVLPASAVGAVRTVDAYRVRRANRGRALLVLDHEQRILLRAGGLWETYGEVARVCRAAGVPAPEHVSYPVFTSSRSYQSRKDRQAAARRSRRKQKPPLYQKAPGYRKLRTIPRGMTARVLVTLALCLAVIGCAAAIGAVPALLLPEWIGAVRVLLGIAGVILGAAAGVWLCAAISHLVMDGLRWAVASAKVSALAPPGRFFRRRARSTAWPKLATAGLVVLVPALIGWGPGVAIASLVHGLSDSQLVAELRAGGVQTPGFVIDVPQYSTDDNGNTTVTDVSTLAFLPNGDKDLWETTDPSIGGRPLPLDAADPADTREPVTVVYLPDDPDTAAAAQQIAGSVWHGAPTANLIVGSLLTLPLPLLIWRLAVRIRRRRWLRDADFLEDMVA